MEDFSKRKKMIARGIAAGAAAPAGPKFPSEIRALYVDHFPYFIPEYVKNVQNPSTQTTYVDVYNEIVAWNKAPTTYIPDLPTFLLTKSFTTAITNFYLLQSSPIFKVLGPKPGMITYIPLPSSNATVVALDNEILKAQDAFLAWASSNMFNQLILYVGDLLACSLFTSSGGISIAGTEDYFRREDLALFLFKAKSKPYNFIVTADSSNERWFVPHPSSPNISSGEYLSPSFYNAFALTGMYGMKVLNYLMSLYLAAVAAAMAAKKLPPKSPGVPVWNLCTFDGLQLEQDWWRFDASMLYPAKPTVPPAPPPAPPGANGVDVGYADITPGASVNSWRQQMREIYNYIKNSIDPSSPKPWILGGQTTSIPLPYPTGTYPSITKTKGDLFIESYFARYNYSESPFSESQQTQTLVQYTDRIILTDIQDTNSFTSAGNAGYYLNNPWNQLSDIDAAAKSLGTRAKVLILFYCTPDIPSGGMFNYFDGSGGPKALGNDFYKAFDDVNTAINLKKLYPNIDVKGYAIFSSNWANRARH